jgi:uncharacterized membrane protein YdbT with pleckstrin-like domain
MDPKYFESQGDSEVVKLVVRKHWFVLLPSLAEVGALYLVSALAMMLPLIIPSFLTGLTYNFFIMIVSLIFLFATNILFYVLLIYYLNVGLVTNEHIVEIVQDRLFSRKVSQLELGKIQDVASKQSGAMQTFLNFGNVEIQSAGELPNFTLKKIPRPNECAQEIVKLTVGFGVRHGIRSEVGDIDANIVKKNIEGEEAGTGQ